MPRAAKRPCTYPGCAALVDKGRCAKHQAQQVQQYRERRTHERRTEDTFYGSVDWKRLRAQVLAEEPNCRRCGKPSKVVDHIVPIRQGGDARDRRNLQGLCWPCHEAKSHAEGSRFGRKATQKPAKGCDRSGIPLDPSHHWRKG